MAFELPIPTILQIAQVSEYLAGNGISKANAFQGGALDERLAKMIYMERIGIQNRYNLNPSDSTLRNTANYLFAILGRYGILAQNILSNQSATISITNPANVSILVGQSAVFSVSVTSSINYSLQWFRNGVAITGATSNSYTLTNAQLSDSGAQFSATATNAAGSVSSASASLTVVTAITVFAWYGSTDPYPALSSGSDTLAYQVSLNINHNAPITVTWPSAAANNMYEVLKVPSTESIKTTYFNTNANQGFIPNPVWYAPFSFGGFTYYVTKSGFSLQGSILTETFS